MIMLLLNDNVVKMIMLLNDNIVKLTLLYPVKCFQVLLCITNNSLLNDRTILFQAIQFCSSHLFVLCLKVTQFYFIHRWDPYQVVPLRVRGDLGAMAVKEYSAFSKAPA